MGGSWVFLGVWGGRVVGVSWGLRRAGRGPLRDSFPSVMVHIFGAVQIVVLRQWRNAAVSSHQLNARTQHRCKGLCEITNVAEETDSFLCAVGRFLRVEAFLAKCGLKRHKSFRERGCAHTTHDILLQTNEKRQRNGGAEKFGTRFFLHKTKPWN